MIIECGKVIIDTELDHNAHKEEIKSKTSFFCEKDEPIQWFTQRVEHEERFFHLHYNKDGTQLQKITSWDALKEHEKPRRLVKHVKGCKNICYFTKDKPELEYEMVEEIDYSANTTSKNHQVIWNRGLFYDKPASPVQGKSRWKWWK